MSFIFNPQMTRFDFTNALRLAEASYWAYLSQGKIQKLVQKGWGLGYRFYFVKDTQAFLCFNDDIIIVAFRGSESNEDWITNLKFGFIRSKVGNIHYGFAMALSYVWASIADAVRVLNNGKRTLWVTGHSLGGALATIAADRFTDNSVKFGGLYTFGQPRVGDKAFCANLNNKVRSLTFRVVNNEDIVPRVPPRELGYSENGNVFYFNNLGRLYRDKNAWRDFLETSKSYETNPKARLDELGHQFPNWELDHDMGNYLRLLKENSTK